MVALVKAILYKPLFNALIFLVWLVPGHSVGWAIVGLTIIIRLILLPSTNKTMKAQKHMRDLQPKIDALKAKYKDNKEEQAKALMDFYKENKVSPLGSCLPLLVQLPIIYILYRVFRVGLDTKRFDLLYSFVPHPATINTMFLGINLAQPDKWILPILTGALQYLQMRQLQALTGTGSTKKTGDAQMDMMQSMGKQMMLFMPILTVLIAIKLPAALPLYWAVTTLFGIAQQWWYFRGDKLAVATVDAEGEVIPTDTENDAPKDEVNKTSLLSKVKSMRKNDVTVTVRRKGE